MDAREKIGRVLDGMDATINLTGEDYRLHRDSATDRIIEIVKEEMKATVPLKGTDVLPAVQYWLDSAFGAEQVDD